MGFKYRAARLYMAGQAFVTMAFPASMSLPWHPVSVAARTAHRTSVVASSPPIRYTGFNNREILVYGTKLTTLLSLDAG